MTWLRPTLGTVDNLAPIDASPPDLHDEMCGGKRHRPASDEDQDSVAGNGAAGASAITSFAAGLQPPLLNPSELLAAAPASSEPIAVYTGPTKTGAALIAAVAGDAASQTTRKGRKARASAKKPDATASDTSDGGKDAKPDSNSAAGPAAARHAHLKPAEKPTAATEKSAAKPAKPKAAVKPSKPRSTTSEAKPADQHAAPRS